MSFPSAATPLSSAPQRSLTVSVIIPVYNADRFLASTLISVLQQDYEAFEVIAVDDGSHDRSVAILTRFAQQDQRVRVIQQAHAGVAAARNRAIALATGDLIAPIDADDLWHPQFLAQHVQRHRQDPEIAVSYCWSLDINHQDQWYGGFQAASIQGWVHDTLLCHYFLGNGSCTVIRRAALASEGYRRVFDPGQANHLAMGDAVCEDWDLYLRLAEQYPFAVIPQFYVGYRKHPQSSSQKTDRMAYWHQQLLRDRRQRLPYLRPWVWNLSQRSFQKYLQQQSTARWGRRAAPSFPLERPIPGHDRLRIRLKLLLVGLLHWTIHNFGQRGRPHRAPSIRPTLYTPPR